MVVFTLRFLPFLDNWQQYVLASSTESRFLFLESSLLHDDNNHILNSSIYVAVKNSDLVYSTFDDCLELENLMVYMVSFNLLDSIPWSFDHESFLYEGL